MSKVKEKTESGRQSAVEAIVSDPTDTEILDWLDKKTKEKCIGTQPYYGSIYANDPKRENEPPYITLHLMGYGFLYADKGFGGHDSFRDAIKLAMREGH